MSYKTTILPDYVGVVQATSINFYNTSTSILDAISDYLAELNQCIEFEKAKVTPDYIKSLGDLYNTLNSTNFTIPNYTPEGEEEGVKQLDNNFKLYFIEQFQSLSDDYKERIDALISGNEYFINFSDDIGYLTDTASVFDNNVNPYFDTFNEIYFNQINIPASLINKVSNNEFKILKTFGYYADPLLKKNLAGLQYDVDLYTAKTAHGDNLVTDVLYYNRMIVNQIGITNVIKSVLGNMSSFVFFFKQLNPKDLDPERKAIFYKFINTDLEGLSERLDLLQNKLKKVSFSSEQALV